MSPRIWSSCVAAMVLGLACNGIRDEVNTDGGGDGAGSGSTGVAATGQASADGTSAGPLGTGSAGSGSGGSPGSSGAADGAETSAGTSVGSSSGGPGSSEGPGSTGALACMERPECSDCLVCQVEDECAGLADACTMACASGLSCLVACAPDFEDNCTDACFIPKPVEDQAYEVLGCLQDACPVACPR